MKQAGNISKAAKIYGIIVTIFMLSTFGLALIGEFEEKGARRVLNEIMEALFKWYDDPTAFFLSYILGYVLIWWKPLLGSIIIVMASIIISVVNYDNLAFLIFAVPTALVGFLYLIAWDFNRKQEKRLS